MAANEYKDITNEQIKQAIVLFEGGKVKQLAVTFAYSGFNLATTLRILVGKARENAAADFTTFATLIACRGTNFNGIRKKSSPEAVALLDALKLRYGLLSTPTSSNDLTLNRVASVLPHLICSVLCMGLGRIVGSVPPTIAVIHCFPGGIHFIKPEQFPIWLLWLFSFQDTAKSVKKEAAAKMKIKDIVQLARQQQKSGYLKMISFDQRTIKAAVDPEHVDMEAAEIRFQAQKFQHFLTAEESHVLQQYLMQVK